MQIGMFLVSPTRLIMAPRRLYFLFFCIISATPFLALLFFLQNPCSNCNRTSFYPCPEEKSGRKPK